MVNANKIYEARIRFWKKVTIAFCLITILLSLLSISSSFATVLTLKPSAKSDATAVFNAASAKERVRVAFPVAENFYLGYDLGVDLGVEKAVM